MAVAVKEVALRRAKLWLLPDSDFYKGFFCRAHACPGTWACESMELLRRWGLPDLPDVGCSLWTYKKQVLAQLSAVCAEQAGRLLRSRRSCMPFGTIYPDNLLPGVIHAAARFSMGWQPLVAVRAFCRLRLGILVLTHVGGKASAAKCRFCIACGMAVTAPVTHAMIRCAAFDEYRLPLCGTVAWGDEVVGRLSSLLQLQPGDEGFEAVLLLAAKVDEYAVSFWSQKGGKLLRTLAP